MVLSAGFKNFVFLSILHLATLVIAVGVRAECSDFVRSGGKAVELILENAEIKIADAQAVESGKSRPLRVTLATGQTLFLKRANRYSEVLAHPEKEVAAYRMSELLGLHVVPSTVLRKIDGQTYSVQAGVEVSSTAASEEAWKKYQNDSDLMFFDYLVNMKDRHSGNLLWDGSKIVLIDHSSAYLRTAELDHRPIIALFTIPKGQTLQRFLELGEKDYKKALGDLLSPAEFQYLLERAALIQFFAGVSPEKISVNSTSIVEIQWAKSATDDEILDAARKGDGIGNCMILQQSWGGRVLWSIQMGIRRAGEFSSSTDAIQRIRELIAQGDCHRYRWK